MEKKLDRMINESQELLERARTLNQIPGASKLERKINAELKCLMKFKKKPPNSLENHLKSTNLTNLRAVLRAVENSPDVECVLSTFYYELDDIGDQLVVDAVVTGGYKWIKVVARKPLAVHRIMIGEGQYGDKDIVRVARDYIAASDQNPINYESPSICFLFPKGLTQTVYDNLKITGVYTIGKVLPDPDYENLEAWNELQDETAMSDITKLLSDFTIRCTRVNLDITTLIVLTSNLTNGYCRYIFKEDILTKQAANEAANPALPELLKYLEGKELVCCQTAYNNFQEILKTVGGTMEKGRAKELFDRVTLIPDDPAFYAMELDESASIKERSKIIFGTGETNQAITTTANTAFVRAAVNQGIKFSSYFHASRALTEQKQAKATPIE
ncbi:UPF0415 protein C7orf25 homolog [Clytia hemisphaerica]|uniref:DUF1308 domain-containing protein n=1 Tax=Clytia hemisphaerica TaxID=252671 RepID=A0A7M5VAF9_9CNID|eukprot:TCONS_00004700-protein